MLILKWIILLASVLAEFILMGQFIYEKQTYTRRVKEAIWYQKEHENIVKGNLFLMPILIALFGTILLIGVSVFMTKPYLEFPFVIMLMVITILTYNAFIDARGIMVFEKGIIVQNRVIAWDKVNDYTWQQESNQLILVLKKGARWQFRKAIDKSQKEILDDLLRKYIK